MLVEQTKTLRFNAVTQTENLFEGESSPESSHENGKDSFIFNLNPVAVLSILTYLKSS